MDLPTGTVTFLFTDIEGSTELWEQDEASARKVLVRHDQIIEALVDDHEGMLVRPRGEGDSRFAVFEQAPGAVAAAASIQRAFGIETWPTPEPLRIRMGLHTGTADLREGDYYGSAVNRCARVRSLAYGGQVLMSLATEQLIADHLSDEIEVRDLGLHPLKGLKRPEQVFQLVIMDVPSEFPPLQTTVGTKHNLPEQLTLFVGREAEFEAVRRLLSEEGTRLVTLKGPGGMGKTRLAIEVAIREAGDFSDGARFVALAPLDSADQIVQAFLESLDLRPASQEDPKDFLLHHLRRAELLIVADNFEHILDGAPLIADLLERAPLVKILATSRERLGLRGETVYDVGGLEFSEWRTVEQAVLSSCAQLFVQGARQVHPEFELEGPDVPHLARICRLVDGNPLALLLSAGWMDMLSLEEIASEVRGSLDFLETELQGAPERQRSVRAVFETSWERLAEPERQLFMKLSVFRGGFTREAAAEVAAADLQSLVRLADKSFVRRDHVTGRYEIHELLRQYGEQQLEAEDGANQNALRAHAVFFAELLAAKEEPLTTANEAEPLDEIEADIENIRRAWVHLAEVGEAELMQRSLLSLHLFHEIRCWLPAGLELFTDIEKRLRASSQGSQIDLLAAQLQAARAWCTMHLGDTEEGVRLATRAFDWLKEHGYRKETITSLMTMAIGNSFLGNPSVALEAGLELSEVGDEIGSPFFAALGPINVAGSYFVMGEMEKAERTLDQLDQLLSEIDGPWKLFWGQISHAALAEARGDLAAARDINQSTINPLRSIAFLRGIQYVYGNLGRINLVLGELDEAELNYARSLRINQETGQMRDALANLTYMAKVWKAHGRQEEAAEVVAAVLHYPQLDHSTLWIRQSIREAAEALRSELEQELDLDQYRAAWATGSGEAVDDVITRILAEQEV